MMNRKTISLFVVFLMGIFAISGFAAEKEKVSVLQPEISGGKVFRIAVQPTTKPIIALKRYQPLVDYLKEATKLNIELAITDSYRDFSDLQKRGKVDFVIQDAFSTYLICQHTKLVPVANVLSPEGKLYDNGFFIVKADSGIKELSDLKGRTCLFGPKANAAKFLAPFIFLTKSEIDVEKDLNYEFGGMCPDNAMSVFLGEYDVGLVCGLYMAQKEKKFNFQTDLRVLAKTGDWAPYWIVSALKKTDKVVVNKIRMALLELDMKNPRTTEVLSICKWKGFAKYSDAIGRISELVKEYAVPN